MSLPEDGEAGEKRKVSLLSYAAIELGMRNICTTRYGHPGSRKSVCMNVRATFYQWTRQCAFRFSSYPRARMVGLQCNRVGQGRSWLPRFYTRSSIAVVYYDAHLPRLTATDELSTPTASRQAVQYIAYHQNLLHQMNNDAFHVGSEDNRYWPSGCAVAIAG